MTYYVKNKSGAEFTVSKELYERCKKSGEYECRTSEKKTVKKSSAWPRPDKKGSYYTLSDGSRVQGKSNAFKAQSEL